MTKNSEDQKKTDPRVFVKVKKRFSRGRDVKEKDKIGPHMAHAKDDPATGEERLSIQYENCLIYLEVEEIEGPSFFRPSAHSPIYHLLPSALERKGLSLDPIGRSIAPAIEVVHKTISNKSCANLIKIDN